MRKFPLGRIGIAEYNEVKKEILSLLDELNEAASKGVAGYIYRIHESVTIALLRYHRQGLISR